MMNVLGSALGVISGGSGAATAVLPLSAQAAWVAILTVLALASGALWMLGSDAAKTSTQPTQPKSHVPSSYSRAA
jgi:hypothetical protein